MTGGERVAAALAVVACFAMAACFILAGVLTLSGDQQGALMVGGLFLFIFAMLALLAAM